VIRALTALEIHTIAGRIDYKPTTGARGVAMMKDRVAQAAILYDHWTYNSVNCHIYSISPKALFNPEFLYEIFSYPFSIVGILLAITPADAEASLKVSQALGFKEIFRVKDGWKVGVDMVFKQMLRDECRWLTKKAA
jgi:hypothetical protein